ncbi:MAG: nickel pincer cofactor biosynthesis protein LarB [Thermoleophilia bacterium]|nr:nickel pincer cofactor biosynthesis protein LarB [Thermoleophilia bacterium]
MNPRKILEQLASGDLTVDEAQTRLSLAGITAVDSFARLDTDRHARKGVPEVVFASGKTPDQLVKICETLVQHTGRAIACGLNSDQWSTMEKTFGDEIAVKNRDARTAIVRMPGVEPQLTGGRLGIISAGTADIPASEQARLVAEEMGCEVFAEYDVGVAGVHRLVEPLTSMIDSRVSAIIVAAGMEGALPSVVAGLVPVPVIGLPTSTGYGLGGEGIAALLSMLQSCCPGLVVVNIDNGVGAGATGALIANRAACPE